MPLRTCTTCATPIPPGTTRCPHHQRATATTRGYNHQWRTTRHTYLTNNPNCERCGQPARDVHHRDGKGPLGPHGHNPTNLEALCHTCHSRHTATNQ